MTPGTGTAYTLRVQGLLDDHRAAWLGGTVVARDEVASTLTVLVRDQAELHGVLAQLRDLGATILELRVGSAPAGDVR